MIPAVRSWTRHETMKRVAFFKDLKGSKTGICQQNRERSWRSLDGRLGVRVIRVDARRLALGSASCNGSRQNLPPLITFL
jgi:hypothetical protein